MRPLTFENLRRLVSRKKDRNEPSFKRSESFKRISIRKSYLDRGKRRNRLQKNLEPVVNSPPPAVANEKIVSQQIKEQELKKDQERSLSRDSITYDEWLQGVSSSSREKLHENHLESLQHSKSKSGKFSRHTDTDSITEDLKILELDASPILTPKSKSFGIVAELSQDETTDGHDAIWTQESSVEGSLSVSISLGRIWRDAVPVPVSVPVSVSVPVPVPVPVPISTASYSSVSNSSVHHSLDSALKEKKPQPTVARTVSAPEKSVSKETSSSSSFGFSLRIARFADFRPGVTRNGLFRRKTPKPSPSVSTEGYFKRTSASRHSNSRRRSSKRTSQRAGKKSQQPAARTSSPVWFVPPERRRSRRQRRVWREIRYFPDEEGPVLERINDWSSNVSDDQFDDQKLLLSGDFNERREDDAFNSIVSSSLGSFSATSSSSSACPAPKISDFNEDKLFSEELRTNGLLVRGATWKLSSKSTAAMIPSILAPTRTIASGNYFASSQFLTFLAKDVVEERSRNENSSAGYRYLSSTDSEDDVRFNERRKNLPQHRQQYLKRQKSGLRRRPLRRKSQLKRASGQPVFLVRKCSSLRKRPSKT
ncbi:hypothetical protein PUN28_012314 [Cardiocondyla obscurior]|uniref:Uncharacterized protein n=1 Tax=Cardiocondyla obscurior TaxID=286306 RepID=A0AAW2FD63_9HYME